AGSLGLVVACLVTAVWAGTFAFAARYGADFAPWVSPMETLRTAAWIGFLVLLLAPTWKLQERVSSSFVIAVALGFIVAAQLGIDLADDLGAGWAVQSNPALAWIFLLARLAAAIGGLFLVHNLYVNTAPANRWSIRLLCIGLAGFFGYDLNLYTLNLLTGQLNIDLFAGRGAVDALVVPLIALSARRNRTWRLQVSRQVAFHTLSLGAVGTYLIAMSVAAYVLRLVGGDWGRLLQIAFLFGAIVLAATVIFSGRFRASARVWINKHFFAYKYDYRDEWLRVIDTMSRTDAAYGALAERAVQAVCEIVDSPGGALYTPGDDGAFEMAARWNYRHVRPGRVAPDSPLAHFLGDRERIVDLDELRAGAGDYGAVTVPDFAVADRDAWLIVPLLHIDRLAGFVVLQQSLARRTLNWEDFDLLRTVGRQAASYIAEQASQAALAEAQKFDEFNRRFAFIMHDIKNLVSQLSLVARNAERHADNPDFRADMVATLQSSVGKMNDLLARLSQHNTAKPELPARADLGAILADVAAAKKRSHAPVDLALPAGGVEVTADAGRLEQVFAHLIQNAIDASPAGSPVRVALAREGRSARVSVEDAGTGMSAAFVRNELFRPFRSTKAGGFGIGAYEAREIVRSLGGRLDVASREGEGTVFTVTLPLVSEAERTPV
ncbi:MAG: PEP-CTERM system histidine kinase PrsK, partial [Alphaproteobacteria bacterium]|nr:PEP-CTERM system histidine kinase PrsK [Alphaproteobacteria bacterium]